MWHEPVLKFQSRDKGTPPPTTIIWELIDQSKIAITGSMGYTVGLEGLSLLIVKDS